MLIVGTPTNTSLKLVTKDIYAKSHAIPSTCRGGSHGHLGLVMPVAKYLIAGGMAFQLPAHPGPVPIHVAGANTTTGQENISLYDVIVKEITIAKTVQEEIKQQLLTVIIQLYLVKINDDTFGFFDLTIATMITHLHTNYGPIMHAKLENNCASISTIWTPDDPIETLWEH